MIGDGWSTMVRGKRGMRLFPIGDGPRWSGGKREMRLFPMVIDFSLTDC